jgi:hypothetical protein
MGRHLHALTEGVAAQKGELTICPRCFDEKQIEWRVRSKAVDERVCNECGLKALRDQPQPFIEQINSPTEEQ